MKIPQSPPKVGDLTARALQRSPGRYLEVFGRVEPWSRTDSYLHWDDLRRRPAPDGFSHEEWWLGLKLGRQAGHRFLALHDSAGHPFGFSLPDALAELLHEIDRGLGFIPNVPAVVTAPESRDRYVIRSLIEEAITSSQLEGASTTREVAKEMLTTNREPRDVSERMILNNYRTMQRIRELRHLELSRDLVFELQTIVTDQTLERPDGVGRFRKADESIRVVDDRDDTILHDPPPADELPARMEAMCAFANGKAPDYFVHPVIRAILLHFWLAYDHPFVDGNGRTARALFYWVMLEHEYELFEFISISQVLRRAPVRYAEAFLFSETDDNDATYFILHQAGVIREAVQALHDYVDRKITETREIDRRLRTTAGLNHRQQALLGHALREPHTRYVIAAHQRSHGVTHQTARDDLFALVERGLLAVAKEGRIYVFRAASDLESRLAEPVASEPPARRARSSSRG